MKRILLASLLIVMIFTGCESSSIGIIGGADGPTAIYVAEEDEWGITILASNVTNTGVTLKINQKGGKAKGELQTGADYFIETMSDGEWKPVETITGDPLVWNALAYIIKKNDTTEMNINWEYGYGKLAPGYYRLAKEIMNFNAPGDYEEKIYYAYFTIE